MFKTKTNEANKKKKEKGGKSRSIEKNKKKKGKKKKKSLRHLKPRETGRLNPDRFRARDARQFHAGNVFFFLFPFVFSFLFLFPPLLSFFLSFIYFVFLSCFLIGPTFDTREEKCFVVRFLSFFYFFFFSAPSRYYVRLC